jgi:dihydrofolate synthase / folylpolyglutamate synthase
LKHRELQELLESLGGEKRVHYTLDRLKAALKKLGNPQETVYSLIIAGTNGKGTTTLLVSSVLAEAGYKVGTFLSPHLVSPNERLLRNLDPIPEPELTELAFEHEPLARELNLTYFEFLTVLFFVWAAREKMDFMVLEVGLGGRLDATNVVDALACAVTNISFDHQAYLGNTLESILEEKLGVMRPEGLVFTGVDSPALMRRLEERCAEVDAVHYYAHEVRREVLERSWEGQKITLNGYPFTLRNPGEGAVKNAALAFLMLRIVFPRLPVSTIQRGFARVRNPGRMEIVATHPRVVLSGDHNPAGLETTIESLAKHETGRLFTVCGFSADKPMREMFERLRSLSTDIRLTRIDRLKAPLPDDYESIGPFTADPHAAIDAMLAAAGPEDTVLVTGSLYLVGQVRPRWSPEVTFRVPDSEMPVEKAKGSLHLLR